MSLKGITKPVGTGDRGNLVRASFVLLVLLIVLAMVALVGGEFIDAVPDTGAFNASITDMESHGGTALTIFAVTLLILPAVAVIGYLRENLGDFLGGRGGGGMGGF